jgi:hypothetical protein
MRRRYLELQDGTRIPLVWNGTRWAVVDYRRYSSVGDYKDAVETTGLHLAICCTWPMSKFMRENGLTFPETFELMTEGYECTAAQHGLRRISLDKAERTLLSPRAADIDGSEIWLNEQFPKHPSPSRPEKPAVVKLSLWLETKEGRRYLEMKKTKTRVTRARRNRKPPRY